MYLIMKNEKFIEKMEKLTPYLPYNLRFQLTQDSHEDYDLDSSFDKMLTKGSVFTLAGYIPDQMGSPFDLDGLVFSHGNNWVSDNYCFKPILRPLSVEEIKKTIYIDNGDEINLYSQLEFDKYPVHLFNEDFWIDYLSYKSVRELIKYHFDIFCLIPKGEAISIYDL
jgi:hypothetical protein